MGKGASDTAGYCVDGTPNTSIVKRALMGWQFENCDSASPGILAQALGALVSVQSIAGIGEHHYHASFVMQRPAWCAK